MELRWAEKGEAKGEGEGPGPESSQADILEHRTPRSSKILNSNLVFHFVMNVFDNVGSWNIFYSAGCQLGF